MYTQELEQFTKMNTTPINQTNNCSIYSLGNIGLSMSTSFIHTPTLSRDHTEGEDDTSLASAIAINKIPVKQRGGLDCSIPCERAKFFISSINDCLTSLNDTNAFMLMTINLCIDYAKAAKGIKLTPQYETINLWETLQMPLSCMKSIQDRVQIELLPLPKELEMCQFIITDRQWLQENLLCLLSNAVKYTNKGKVVISVTFHEQTLASSQTSSAQQRDRSKRMSKFSSRSMKTNTGSGHQSDRKQSQGVCQVSERLSSNSLYSQSSNGSSKQKWIMYSVEDDGIGVSPEAMVTLFKPFKQAQRLTGGTGLGLYSLAKRVEAVQGDYGVRQRSDGHRGSVFWFTIPYRPDETMLNAEALRSATISESITDKATVDSSDRTSENNRRNRALQTLSSLSSRGMANGCIVTESGFGHVPMFVPTAISSKLSEMQIQSTSQDHVSHLENAISMDSSHTNDGMSCDPNSNIVTRESLLTINDHHSIDSNVGLTKSIQNLNILLVDDAPTILKMTSMMLRKLGHTIAIAENGEEAVNMVETYWKKDGKCYDVILMDLQMPVMDGLEATKRIRAMELRDDNISPLPKQIILGVSANSDHETEEQALLSGVNAFIAKPFKANMFVQIMLSLRS